MQRVHSWFVSIGSHFYFRSIWGKLGGVANQDSSEDAPPRISRDDGRVMESWRVMESCSGWKEDDIECSSKVRTEQLEGDSEVREAERARAERIEGESEEGEVESAKCDVGRGDEESGLEDKRVEKGLLIDGSVMEEDLVDDVRDDDSIGVDEVQQLIREQHALAKAVKSDDAAVPVHLWDERVLGRIPTKVEQRVLERLRGWLLWRYRQQLLHDCLSYMRNRHGVGWHDRGKYKKGAWRTKSKAWHLDKEGLMEIMWRAVNNEWFEYTGGSRLKFFRFPTKYRTLARDGVPIFFLDGLPTPMSELQRPLIKGEERDVLRGKLQKAIAKRYLAPPSEKLRSCIKYFAVPKGVLEGVVQDW